MHLGDNNFFNLFQRVAAASNKNRDCDEWKFAGVHWSRQRHSNWSAGMSWQVEVQTLRHTGRKPWTLLFVHEMWWPPGRKKAIRNARWVHLAEGARKDAARWFAEREAELV